MMSLKSGKTLFPALLILAVLVVMSGRGPTPVRAAGTDDFIITVKTDNPGLSPSTHFTIPTAGGSYNYNVD